MGTKQNHEHIKDGKRCRLILVQIDLFEHIYLCLNNNTFNAVRYSKPLLSPYEEKLHFCPQANIH